MTTEPEIVKLDTYPWKLSQAEFNFFTPNQDGVVNGFKFEVNNNCGECDYWVIRGGIDQWCKKVKCPAENIIFIEDEVYTERNYNINFLKQFAAVIGPLPLNHRRYIQCHEMLPWFFRGKAYSFLKDDCFSPLRERDICLMTSDATWIEGHRKRFAFSNKLIGHFKERLDVYGRGFNSFDCKFEVLKKYKYCICIENNSYPDYFTEKINECFLSGSMPIYYGCPNIFDYYKQDSIISIDIDDFEGTVQKIENALTEKIFEKNQSSLNEMKHRFLDKYNFPVKLTEILKNNFAGRSIRKQRIIFTEKMFFNYKEGLKHLSVGIRILLARLLTATLKN